ncbi:cytochrome P450 CYP72A219-like isoform X1 [Rhododendron vialii]|uniref:cytochrome P450 CYP72A219-like isoform X1 n=1 Tax=Rhododendron vialii TaxID=182163 RepID=UPI00265F153A|nr:cytochrome P450 CYP72A219-like isoform X1 [Rhododendron vialii]
MEVTASSILLSLALATFLTCAWKAVNWVWFRPKQLERCLRDQGFKGNPYRFLYGDSKVFVPAIIAARSKPMEANDDDIVPRVIPFHQYFVNLHGTNYFAWMGPIPRVNITDPKLIKDILSNTEVFQKPFMNPLGKFIVTGILAYEGEKWATHRSLVNPAFHLEKLKLMVPAMYSSCCEMISKWEVSVSTKGSCELDVWPYLSNLTADVISRTAFGSDYEEGKQIFELQKEQTDLLMQPLRSMYIPGWKFLPTKTNRKMRKIYNEVGALVRNIINKRQRTMNGEGDTDLLGILLKSNLKAMDQELGSKNIKLTVEDIIEECKLFYLAGQETTSVLLVWTMVMLSKHQKWQALAREEVLAVFGDNKPDFDGLHQLKTVTMILNEVMRLYSPVAFLVRYIHKNTKLGGLVLPAGTEIMVPTITIHHDPEIWGEDSKNFKPERFSEGIVKATRGQGTFFPFGGGPRICIGQNFALVEAKIALAMILKRFYFQLSPSYVHAPSLMLTVQPQHGAHLILQKII